jgi:O-antigen ligase
MDANALEQQGAHGVVGKYTPHDDLLNIWLSWGFFALAIYVGFSLVMGWNFYQTFINTADPLLKGLAIGGLSALIAFQVNSLFHNFLDATLTLWILGGFSLLLLKLDRKRPPRRPHRERRVIPTEPLL